MAIDSAYKTIQHAASLQDQNLEVAQDGVEQSRFGRPSSRPMSTEKDVKYEAWSTLMCTMVGWKP